MNVEITVPAEFQGKPTNLQLFSQPLFPCAFLNQLKCARMYLLSSISNACSASKSTACNYLVRIIPQLILQSTLTFCVRSAGTAMGDLNRRKGMILDATTNGDDAVIDAQV